MSGPGSRRDHHRFCDVDGWTEVRNARGRKVGHHITYELALPNGHVLRTRISWPPNNDTYGPRLWNTILADQLQVTETQFWACVSNRERPDRGTGANEPPASAVPADLVYQLIRVARIPEDTVAGMTLQRATEVMVAHWSRPKG